MPISELELASKYSDCFACCSYALKPHFKLEVGRSIHPYFGVMALTAALFLQMSDAKVYEC